MGVDPGQGVGVCATLEVAKVTASASPVSAFRSKRADKRFFAKIEETEVGEISILDSPISARGRRKSAAFLAMDVALVHEVNASTPGAGSGESIARNRR